MTMKRNLCVLFAGLFFLLSHFQGRCLADGLFSFDYAIQKSSISSEDLLGDSITGVCFGDDSVCVYTSSSYEILDMTEQWKIIASVSIDHPNIRKDAPYVKQVVYESGTYYLLVFDHETSKSYIITQHENQTNYGKLYAKEIKSFALTDDGFFMTGMDNHQRRWNAQVSKSGTAVWEHDSTTQNDVPVYCATMDDGFLTVGSLSSTNTPSIVVLRFDSNGNELSRNEISPASTADIASYQIFQVDATNDDVALCGILSSGTKQVGFFLRLNQDGSIIDYQEYPQFARIQSFANEDGQYILLAQTDMDASLPYDSYIIAESTGLLYPLEEKNSIIRSLGLSKDSNGTVYLYGMIDESVLASDGFIAELKLK